MLCLQANDIFFHILPLCDNFWQAQATVMLTPRLPLYILCIYFCMMYSSHVTAMRLKLPALAEASAAGLLSFLFYMPYGMCWTRVHR